VVVVLVAGRAIIKGFQLRNKIIKPVFLRFPAEAN
jgi:hypothetical protein